MHDKLLIRKSIINEDIEDIKDALIDHPYLTAGITSLAGILGLLSLQKRKKRLPEPGKYFKSNKR